MKLCAMRFKDYVWPHNPKTYAISFEKEIAEQRVPFGEYTLQGMGRKHRVLRGTGEFAGPEAYREFKKLATVFYENTPGMLIHPLWDAAKAWFAALELNQEPTENYVSYSFEFWECCDRYETGLTPLPAAAARASAAETDEDWYTAVWGDCLWNIAANHGLSMNELLTLNPQIKNPNLLYVGDRVRVG